MKIRIAIAVVMSLVLWLPVSVRAENTLLIGGQPVPLGPTGLAGSRTEALPKAPVLEPGPNQPTTVFRDVPSVSGRYSVAGTTLMPYVGAGFNSGYASDLDRSLHAVPPAQTDTNLRNLFGQNLAPSEFQMGVRIPF